MRQRSEVSEAADSVQAATAVPFAEIKPACETEKLILNLKTTHRRPKMDLHFKC